MLWSDYAVVDYYAKKDLYGVEYLFWGWLSQGANLSAWCQLHFREKHFFLQQLTKELNLNEQANCHKCQSIGVLDHHSNHFSDFCQMFSDYYMYFPKQTPECLFLDNPPRPPWNLHCLMTNRACNKWCSVCFEVNYISQELFMLRLASTEFELMVHNYNVVHDLLHIMTNRFSSKLIREASWIIRLIWEIASESPGTFNRCH